MFCYKGCGADSMPFCYPGKWDLLSPTQGIRALDPTPDKHMARFLAELFSKK